MDSHRQADDAAEYAAQQRLYALQADRAKAQRELDQLEVQAEQLSQRLDKARADANPNRVPVPAGVAVATATFTVRDMRCRLERGISPGELLMGPRTHVADIRQRLRCIPITQPAFDALLAEGKIALHP